MNHKLKIELFDEFKTVSFYSIRFKNEIPEIEKFLNKFPANCEYNTEINIILKWINTVGEEGAFERRFRVNEGRLHDRVCAIPANLDKCDLRLYAIRISDNIVILGNGDIKTTATYNEDEKLKKYVSDLQSLDSFISNREYSGRLEISGKIISGDLNFYFKEEK